MLDAIDKKRVWIFIAITFAIAWAFALVIFLTGGLTNSPFLTRQNMTLASLLLSWGVMMAPLLGNILTRVITREGSRDLYLRPFANQKAGLYWLAGWLAPVALILLGMVFYFVVYPATFDSDFSTLASLSANQTAGIRYEPRILLFFNLLQGILFAPILNGLYTFGEEFGWRGYLMPKLRPLGSRLAVLISGVVWGVWHAPIIAMGHNYGFDYPGYPWTGILMMTLFTIIFGVFLSWITLKEGSVWPAVIAHAVLNGVAAFPAVLVEGSPNTLMGPFVTGLVAGLPTLVLAVVLLVIPAALTPGILRPMSD